MKKELDIHNYKRRIEHAVRALEASDISEKNKKVIMDFKGFCGLTEMSLARTDRYIGIVNCCGLKPTAF
jgi:hypothetical protein